MRMYLESPETANTAGLPSDEECVGRIETDDFPIPIVTIGLRNDGDHSQRSVRLR